MQDIIWIFVGVFYLWLSLWGSKEHKKLGDQLKKEPKSVNFAEYLILGFWPLSILFAIFIFVFMAIKIIF